MPTRGLPGRRASQPPAQTKGALRQSSPARRYARCEPWTPLHPSAAPRQPRVPLSRPADHRGRCPARTPHGVLWSWRAPGQPPPSTRKGEASPAPFRPTVIGGSRRSFLQSLQNAFGNAAVYRLLNERGRGFDAEEDDLGRGCRALPAAPWSSSGRHGGGTTMTSRQPIVPPRHPVPRLPPAPVAGWRPRRWPLAAVPRGGNGRWTSEAGRTSATPRSGRPRASGADFAARLHESTSEAMQDAAGRPS